MKVRVAIGSFAALAFAGLAVSAVAHSSTFFGIDPSERFPFVWALHVGIFVVFIPAIMAANHVAKRSPGKPSDEDEVFTSYVPRPLKILCGLLFVYAFFNFFLSFVYFSGDGTPRIVAGEKALHGEGEVIRKLTDEEYRLRLAHVVRGFSGHWMVFYCVAGAMLLAAGRQLRAEPPTPKPDEPDSFPNASAYAVGVRRVPSSPPDP